LHSIFITAGQKGGASLLLAHLFYKVARRRLTKIDFFLTAVFVLRERSEAGHDQRENDQRKMIFANGQRRCKTVVLITVFIKAVWKKDLSAPLPTAKKIISTPTRPFF
jgi:hypothetical protein